ncbi:MAG: hypothetical protein HYU69_12130 [Bacteroidetes bacterium]|nr:hypothetical protein [Bacteroidota bacterium]
MIAMNIDFFEINGSMFYKLLISPKKGEEIFAVDTLQKQIQKFISEHRDLRHTIYTCTGNQYLKMIEFYK